MARNYTMNTSIQCSISFSLRASFASPIYTIASGHCINQSMLCVTRLFQYEHFQWEPIFHPKENYTQRWDKTENFEHFTNHSDFLLFLLTVWKLFTIFYSCVCVCAWDIVSGLLSSRLRYRTTINCLKINLCMSLCINDVVHINLFKSHLLLYVSGSKLYL